MEDALDVVMLVNEVQAVSKSVRDHKRMVTQLAGRINALQSLILSLVEDAGQACPPEFLERLQEELEAAATTVKRCTRSAGYRERYYEDITIDLKDVNFRIVNWLGDLRAHMVSAGMQEARNETHHQERALRILKEIRDSQERFEDFGSFAEAELKDARGESADFRGGGSRPGSLSMDSRRNPSLDSRRNTSISYDSRRVVRRSIDNRRGGTRPGSLSMDHRSRPNSIERSRANSFDSEDSRRDFRPRSLWTEAVLEEEARIEELRRRARRDSGESYRDRGDYGRERGDYRGDYGREKRRDSGDYYREKRRDSEDYYRERRESGDYARGSRRSTERRSLGEGHSIVSPANAVDFHDEVDRVLTALENTGDMDRVIEQIIETQTLGEREREFLIGKSQRLKKERAPPPGPVFGDIGAGPWGDQEGDADDRANRARPATDTEQELLKDVEEARKLAKEFRDGNKQYRDMSDELLGSELGYLPQTVKEEAAVAVVEITTALAVASDNEPKPWTFSPRASMDTIHEGNGKPDHFAERVSAALLAAGNEAPTRRLSSGGAGKPSIIPLDLPKPTRGKRTQSNGPHTLEDDIAAALKAQQESTGKSEENPGNVAPGVIAIGTNGPVAIGAKMGGITGWPHGLLRTASIPPSGAARAVNRTNPEALLKDKQREEASVMEKVYEALKAVKIGERVSPEEVLGKGTPGSSFCELPTGPKVLRKDTKEVKKEIFSFLDEINSALETARNGPPPGAENLTRDPPPEFICPLSGSLMRDPVMLIETEHNYERDYIDRWFARGHRVCPASGVAVHTTTTLRNHKLRGAIRDWVKLEEISPRVELVQPRAETPLSSTNPTPKGDHEKSDFNEMSMEGRQDDIVLDVAPDGSAELRRKGGEKPQSQVANQGSGRLVEETPVEKKVVNEGPVEKPNGSVEEPRAENGHGTSSSGSVSGSEIVDNGSVGEEVVDEKKRPGSDSDGDRASPESVLNGDGEKERDAGETSPPTTFGGAKSRVKSVIQFFNTSAFAVPSEVS
jgi:hypothetical protein